MHVSFGILCITIGLDHLTLNVDIKMTLMKKVQSVFISSALRNVITYCTDVISFLEMWRQKVVTTKYANFY